MLYADFEQLKQFIKEKNSYLQHVYAHAYKDLQTGGIYTRYGTDMVNLLPGDGRGAYCYLRHDGGIRHEARPAERLTDTHAQRLSFADAATLQWVAIVPGADPYLLLQNMRNTAMLYTGLQLQPTGSEWQRERVVQEEMKDMRPEDITAALSRLKDETVVRLTLQAAALFVPSSCIVNPCCG